MDDKEYRGSTRRDNDTRPIPPQRVCVFARARARVCVCVCVCVCGYSWHRSSNLSDFFCEFSAIAPDRAGNGESTVVHLPHQKVCVVLRFFLSSIPRHRLCFTLATSVLTLIPGDPSTRVVAF
ncbi:hypothetical protein P5V15_013238 [Pogonomyrmex californicus]